MARNIDNEILIHYLTNQDNTFTAISKKYDVSIYKVKKVVEEYFRVKNCKHEFYEIDSWTGLMQCKLCEKFRS
jgi:hypothetical protein